MTINRVVNGVEMEFELTSYELDKAYREQKREYLIDDIKSQAEQEEILLEGKDIEKIADIAEHCFGNDDMMWDCYWEDIRYTLKNYEED